MMSDDDDDGGGGGYDKGGWGVISWSTVSLRVAKKLHTSVASSF